MLVMLSEFPRHVAIEISAMAKWSQYELWIQTGENKWEMIGVFPDAELPTALAKSRARRARLIEVRYEGSKMLGQEVIAEIGTGGKDK